jgi:hypothetical protein
MDDDKPIPGPDPQPRRRVPPPTIDLAATDVSPRAESTAAANPASDSPPADVPAGDSQPTGPAAEPGPAPADAPRAAGGETAGSSADPSPPSAAAPRRAPVWPQLVAGAVGAALVLGVVAGAWIAMGPGVVPRADQVTDKVTDKATDKVADQVRAQDSEVNARLARIEAQLAAPRGGTPVPAPDPKALDALTQRLGRIDATLADLGHRADQSAAAARSARERADAAAQSLADLTPQVAQLGAEAAHAPTVDRSDMDSLAGRIAGLEGALKALNDRLGRSVDPAGERATRIAVFTGALKSAVERGAPYERQLAAARPFIDADAFGALQPFAQTGVPSAAALARDASRLVPELLKETDASPPNGVVDRLWGNAKRLVHFRPIGEAQGEDPPAVIARIEAKAARNDIDGVLAEIDNLPPSMRGPIEPWTKRAQARGAAIAATDRLAADALDRLGRTLPQGAPER